MLAYITLQNPVLHEVSSLHICFLGVWCFIHVLTSQWKHSYSIFLCLCTCPNCLGKDAHASGDFVSLCRLTPHPCPTCKATAAALKQNTVWAKRAQWSKMHRKTHFPSVGFLFHFIILFLFVFFFLFFSAPLALIQLFYVCLTKCIYMCQSCGERMICVIPVQNLTIFSKRWWMKALCLSGVWTDRF